MIKKEIIKFNKIFFIMILSLSFYNNKNNNINFEANNEYKILAPDEAAAYLQKNKELLKLFCQELLTKTIQTHSDIIFKIYKEKEIKNPLTIEEFKTAALSENNDTIVNTLAENIKYFFDTIIQNQYLEKDQSINLLKTKENLAKMILDNYKNIETEPKSNESVLLFIIKRKEQEFKIKEIINNHYKNSTSPQINKKYIDQLEYIYKQPINEQQNIIDNLSLGLDVKTAFAKGNIEPLTNLYEQKLNQYKNETDIKIQELVDKQTLLEEKIKKQFTHDSKSTPQAQASKTQPAMTQEELDFIRQEMANKKNQNKEDVAHEDENNLNKINKLIARIEKLEKNNERSLYAIIGLGIICAAALYKSFFSSEEN
jgi:hypothetical protein